MARTPDFHRAATCQRQVPWVMWLVIGFLMIAFTLSLSSCAASGQSSSSTASASASMSQGPSASGATDGVDLTYEHPYEGDPDAVTINVMTSTLSMMPIVDEEVQSTYDFLMKVAKDFEETYTDHKVIVNVEEFSFATGAPDFAATIGTDEMPNVLLENYFNMESYIHTGYVVPLDDIISDEVRDDIDPRIWEMSQIDGKTYLMPLYTYNNILAYNRDMFHQAGLDAYMADGYTIQSWTMDQWNEILEALSHLDEYYFPMSMYAGGITGDAHIMVLLRAMGSNFFDENGNFNLNTPEGIAALQWIKDNYDKGYYPPVSENLTIEQMANLFYDRRLGLHLYNIVFADRIPVEEFGFVNFPSSDGKGAYTSFMTGFEVFDTGNQQELEVSKAFVKYIMETDEWMDYTAGLLPVSERVIEKFEGQMPLLKMFAENDAEMVDFTDRNPNWGEVRQVFYPYIHDLLTGKKTPEQVAEQLDAEANAILEAGRAESQLHE